MKTIRIIGVPEHFNMPWHLAIDAGDFSEAGLDVQWQDVAEGTGKMCQMLRENQTDLALVLTEGIFKDISKGNPSVVVHKYVSSPLQWGVFVSAESKINHLDELKGKRVAISRFGSGSELMARVQSKKLGFELKDTDFIVVNTLQGAIEMLGQNKADYFMWDRFMTQPVVDKGIFKRIGVCPTPWPSFMLVARKEFAQKNKGVLKSISRVMETITADFANIPNMDATISSKYNLPLHVVRSWFGLTHWSVEKLKAEEFDEINSQLLSFNILEHALDYAKTVFKMDE